MGDAGIPHLIQCVPSQHRKYDADEGGICKAL